MSASLLMDSQALQSNAFIDVSNDLTPRYDCHERFRLEEERLKTFDSWPLEWLDKSALATTGMFYTGVNDRTKCYFCEVIIGKWERSDDVLQEHLRWSPNCPLLKRRTTNNVPLNEKNLDLLLPPIRHATYDTPPATGWHTIPSEDYSIKAVRLHTFEEWPRSIKQRPRELVDAGFYYKGVGDCVICFSCLSSLKDWEEDDDPWEQHALWMGHYCPYVKLTKGEEFIKYVHNKFKNYRPKELEQNELEVREPAPEYKEYKSCKICFEKECNTVYVPCGHVVACTECALSIKECPICRALITNVVRLYFS